jgi:hypothetical protein
MADGRGFAGPGSVEYPLKGLHLNALLLPRQLDHLWNLHILRYTIDFTPVLGNFYEISPLFFSPQWGVLVSLVNKIRIRAESFGI